MKQFLMILIFCILLIITVWFGIQVYQEQQIMNKKAEIPYIAEETVQNESINEITTENETENKTENEIENNKEENTQEQTNQMPEKYGGYAVEAKLEIPAIQLVTYVIKPYSKQSLNVSVTKFWGANANQVGNFCVAGHNFQNKMMFRNLKKLNIGNKIYVTDQQKNRINYNIYDIYTVLPNDVNCLSQQTGGKREITLITCTFDSQKRIIVKGRAV